MHIRKELILVRDRFLFLKRNIRCCWRRKAFQLTTARTVYEGDTTLGSGRRISRLQSNGRRRKITAKIELFIYNERWKEDTNYILYYIFFAFI